MSTKRDRGHIFYYFPDQLGSTRTITTGNGPGQTSGQLCYDQDYTPYGQEVFALNGGYNSEMWTKAEPLYESWKSYRKHRFILICLLLGWIPIGLLANGLLAHFHLPWFFSTAVSFVWLLLILAESGRVTLWPCPACGKRFRGYLPFLPKQCVHCGSSRVRSRADHP